jgi:hypothetical protein
MQAQKENPAGRRGFGSLRCDGTQSLYAHISAREVYVQSQSDASNVPSIPERVRRIRHLDWFSISDALSPVHLASLLYRWRVAFRSFRAHIRIQSAKGGTQVDLGPAFLLRDGCYQENKGTIARAEGIRKLLATHPWADSVDLRMYLVGFQAGEGYCNATRDLDIQDVQKIPQKTNLQLHSCDPPKSQG